MDREYIEKEAFRQELINTPFYPRCKTTPDLLTSVQDRLNDTIELLDNFPPADVKPVVRGEWKWNDDNAYAAAVSHEMTAKEFVREPHRMCQSKMECAECRICHDDGEPRSCVVLMGINPEDTVAIVEAWAREHPERSEDDDER